MQEDQAPAAVQVMDVKIEGEVNAPVFVTLYDDDGLQMQVHSEDVNAWLAKGFKREKFDIHAKHTELSFMFDSAKEAVAHFISDVTANGVINTAAGESLDVAVQAMAQLHDTWTQLNLTIGNKYAVVQNDPPATPDGYYWEGPQVQP